jgi:predicted GH43/DUF377 family glycosyl hydrolase
MALFPRKFGKDYVMLGRQDGESLYLLRSTDLLSWEHGEILARPEYAWELIQIGNCGAPIELEEGWLVLTHGVGAMRKYSIGALLLDRMTRAASSAGPQSRSSRPRMKHAKAMSPTSSTPAVRWRTPAA